MSAVSDSHIYTGAWIDYSRGHVFGATITLSARNGGLLTSFLGVFVTIVGGQFWLILSFIIHQIRASKEPRDGLHHQQHNILRNSTSAGPAAYQFTQLAIYWRHHARQSFRRSMPWAILGACYLSLFGIAGVFSSEVTKSGGSDRLVRGSNCGT
jgi:hypothetical protein